MKIKCPACEAVLSISVDTAGKIVKCPCGRQLRVPAKLANTAGEELGAPFPNSPAGTAVDSNLDPKERTQGGTESNDFDDSPNPFAQPQPYAPPASGSTVNSANLQYPVPGTVSPVAIISLVLGILSLTMGCCCWLHIPLGIGAVVTGGFGISFAKQGRGGKGLAIAGLVCGLIALIGYTTLLLIGVAMNLQNGGFNP